MQGTELFTRQPNYSKFAYPKHSLGYVRRVRLINHLSRVANQKYVLIQAPQGYGKTSLLYDWYQSVLNKNADTQTIWFSVDADDCDPRCFWSNLVGALELYWPGIRDAVENSMQLFERSTMHEMVIAIANQIVRMTDKDREYTLIMTNLEAFKFSESEMQFFLFVDMLPPNLHLVMSSRISLDSRLFGQRTFDDFAVIGVQELALSKEELRQFIFEQIGRELAEEYCDKAYAKTEGWPLAIHVLLQAVQPGMEIEDAIDRFTGNNTLLSEFVFEKTMAELPQRIVTFLIETAFVRRFCAPLCDYVTQSQESLDIIKYLVLHGIFTYPLDMEGVWYRYHILFSEWLMSYAMKLRCDQLRILNHRAGQWFRYNKMPLASTKFVIAATDNVFVSRLAQFVFPDITSEYTQLLKWLFSFTDVELESEPRFCLLAAWAYAFLGRPNDAMSWSNRLTGLTRSDGTALFLAGEDDANGVAEIPWPRVGKHEENVGGHLSLALRIIKAKCLILQGESEKGIGLSQEILNEMDPHMDTVPRTVLLQCLGEACEQMGDVEAAMKNYLKAMSLARANKFKFITGFTRFQVANLLFEQGQLEKSESRCRNALSECPQDFTVYGALYSLLALIKLEQNKLEELQVIIKRASTRISADRNIDIYLDVCVAQSAYLAALGEADDAQMHLEVAIDKIRKSNDVPPRGIAFHAFVQQARNYYYAGDLSSAEEMLDEFELFDFPSTVLSELSVRVMRARVTLARGGQMEELAQVLDALAQQAKAADYRLLQVRIHIMQAVTYHRLNERALAIRYLKRALELAYKEQVVRSFLEEGDSVRVLLVEALSSGDAGYAYAGFVRMLLRAFNEEQEMRFKLGGSSNQTEDKTTRIQAARSERMNTLWNLTRREQEIVGLLQEGLSRKEIAVHFCTSQNTVKTHIAHVYEKLNVHSVPELLHTLMENDLF
jgi:LuxR family maltose regulon positive regulatory protein